MRLVAFCVLLALAFTRSDDFEDALPEEAFLPEVIFDMEMTQEVAPIVKGTSPYAGVYAVFYRGRQRSTDMTIDCNGKATQKRIFSENLQFSGVKAKCSQARDAKATMYILNTHGKNKYECLRRSGEANLQGSHYIGPNRFWGTVLYKLKKKIVCGITKKAEVCTTKKGTNFRGPPGNEDVKRVDNTKTLAACSALCTANKLCTYFVYQSIYKRCWLKKNYTHKQVDATCESGMKCVTKAKTASATQPAGGPAYIKSVTSSTIKKDVKKLAKKYFSSKQTLKRVNKTRKVVAHLEGDIDDEEDKPLSYLKKNSQGKNRIFGHAYDQYGRLKSKLKKNGQVRRPGYTPADAYTSPSGHYYLGMSRRRIGAGFGRRRRTYVPKKAVKKAVKKTVINAVKNEAKQKAKKKGVTIVKRARPVAYQHCNFGGYKRFVRSTSWVADLGVKNDDLSSIKVPKGKCVTLFEHRGFKGKHWKICGPRNVKCFVQHRNGGIRGNWNDKVSSIKVSTVKSRKELAKHFEVKAKHWLHGSSSAKTAGASAPAKASASAPAPVSAAGSPSATIAGSGAATTAAESAELTQQQQFDSFFP